MSAQLFIPLRHEIIVDNFAGGGGASTGIEAALGRPVDIAVNHDAEALAMHEANHPGTRHLRSDVFEVDPLEVTGGQPVGLAWFSPDCKHFSKAKGGKPVDKRIRGLAWVVIKWARTVKPRVIMLENVEEFQHWGPLDADNKPCPRRRGLTFRRWLGQLKAAGYHVETRELVAADYGAPTIRKRLFIIARCDGRPIVWPKPTHGTKRQPYRAAAECIDWSLPCPSIFGRKRPLAEATLRRIARGIWKYVLTAKQPFIVPVTHQGDVRVHGVDEAMRTVTGAHRGEHALIAPALINTRNGEREGQAPRVRDIQEPCPTVTARGSQGALVAAFLAKHFGGNETPGWPLEQPISTVTAQDHHALVTSHLLKLKGTCRDGQPVDAPLHTIQAGGCHYGEVRAFLVKYFGTAVGQSLNEPAHTLTAKARLGLVTVAGTDYVLVDIGMRMLQPRELFNAQGFPADYIITPEHSGKPLTKTAQIRLCGNSVCPPAAEALVRANFKHEAKYEAAIA